MNVEILMLVIVTAMATSLIGVFLVLRGLSMMTDAISHTILLGIVIAYYFVNDLNSPYLLVGATMMGVLTVYLIEGVMKVKHVDKGAAIGIVFTMLFSVAIIIVNTALRNVHLDIHTVLLGKLEFSVFNRAAFAGIDLPVSLWVMAVVLLINVTVYATLFKEIKLVSFDSALAGALGFLPGLIFYIMMTLASLTAVAAFDAVGAILVIALMVGPPATALFFSKSLFYTILYTLAVSVFNGVLGYQLSVLFDVTISGMIATMTLVSFLLGLTFSPRKGLLSQWVTMKSQKRYVAFITLLEHIRNHQHEAEEELNVHTIHEHFSWKQSSMDRMIEKGEKQGLIEIRDNLLCLTRKGRSYYIESQGGHS